MKRIVGLDIFRGYAILLMIIFHFCFDLNHFNLVHIEIRTEAFWKYFRVIIVSMFIFSAGVSLKLAHYKGISLQAVKKRLFILGSAALLVSVGSYMQFPNTWIYFGVLHFILFASIIGIVFVKTPTLSLLVAVGILFGYHFGYLSTHWLFEIVQGPLHLPAGYTEDLVGIFPWMGVFLLGVAFGGYNLHRVVFDNAFFNAPKKIHKLFILFGRHSLLIYLIHQPILFGVLYLWKSYL